MKNKLLDLNNHLFAQLERLGDESISEEKLAIEVRRTKSICDVSVRVIDNANTCLKAIKLREEYNIQGGMSMLESPK